MIGNLKNDFSTETLKYSQDFSFMTVNCSNLSLHCLLTPAKGVNNWDADSQQKCIAYIRRFYNPRLWRLLSMISLLTNLKHCHVSHYWAFNWITITQCSSLYSKTISQFLSLSSWTSMEKFSIVLLCLMVTHNRTLWCTSHRQWIGKTVLE